MPEIRVQSPYLQAHDALWLRGNLHTHSTRSDGAEDPQAVVQRYADAGYDFLVLSDHDVLADLNGLDPCGMVLMAGNEVSAEGPHTLHVGASSHVQPDPIRQVVMDGINAGEGFAILCHPNWENHYNHCSMESMLALKGYTGVEIFNGNCLTSTGSAYATDKWDRLLSVGRHVWGFANDDSHSPWDVGIGWNVVRARERSAESILDALRTGSFYASSGITIERIVTDGPHVRLESRDAQAIAIIGEYGRRLHMIERGSLDFDTSDLPCAHFRIECYGMRNTFAWTQPMKVLGGLAEKLAKLGEEIPILKVHHADRSPVLDGCMSDEIWRQAAAADVFLKNPDASKPPVKTEFRCILADGALHFACRCEEPSPDEMKLTVTEPGSTRIWTNDSVELFLDIDGRAAHYYQIMLSANGTWSVSQYGEKRAKPEARVVAGQTDFGWCVEATIPLDGLGADA